jgi:hypothetical protein
MNRRNNPNTNCDGVDVNCNCDFMFRVIGPATSLAIRILRWNRLPASLPFSEPEAINIRLLFRYTKNRLLYRPSFFQRIGPSPLGTCSNANNAAAAEFYRSAVRRELK